MLDYPGIVDAAFLHRYGDGRRLTSTDRMNSRQELAKSLLARKYSHLTSELERNATEQNEADVDEWNLILDDISFAEDVPRYIFSLTYLYYPPSVD